MKYKKDIEKLLFDLKINNVDRDQIEHDLDYSENYIDQILSKGGNKRFYSNLKKYADRMLQKTTDDESNKSSKKKENADNEPEEIKQIANESGEKIISSQVEIKILRKENEYLKKRVEDLEKIVSLLSEQKMDLKKDFPMKKVGAK